VSGSTTKKVILDRFDRERIRGFVHPQSYLQAAGVEVMSPDGSVGLVPYAQIKAVSFVRDLDGDGVFSERREFLARPKALGLWVELRFRDGDLLQGVLPNNLQMLEPDGYAFSPPETAGNAQRVFVPRQALDEVLVLGVNGTKKKPAIRPADPQQIRLFEEAEPASTRVR
jgi:hypothetical protein